MITIYNVNKDFIEMCNNELGARWQSGIVESEGGLYNVDLDAAVILKTYYPDFVLDLGGRKVIFENKDFETIAIS